MLLGIDTPVPGFDIVGTLDPPQVTLTVAEVEQRALAERPDIALPSSLSAWLKPTLSWRKRMGRPTPPWPANTIAPGMTT